MTENDAFNLPMGMDDRNTIFIDRMLSQMTSVSSAQPTSLSLNQNQIMAEFPALSMFQGDPMNNLHASPTISNHFGIVDCNTSIPTAERLGKNTNITNPSLNSSRLFSNSQLQEQCMGRPVNPLEILDTSISNHYLETLNSAFATSVSCGYDGVLGGLDHKLYLDKFLACPEAAMEVPGTTGFQPFQLMGNVNVIHSGWTSSDNANMSPENLSGSFKFSNELPLSTCQHSIFCGTSIPGQCSEISCSGVTHHPLNERQFGSETSCNSKNLSRSIGSHIPVQLSQFSSESKYLSVIQEILAEIASYSFSSSCLSDRGYAPMGHDGAGRSEVQMGVVLQGREVEAKKKQFLALLQVVDERYNQCLDETHTVISAFHAATELDPHVHARFALQTISSLYKNLRERISNQILAMGGHFNRRETRGEDQETSFQTSFIKKQWALQQLRRKDHQLWRPQRGLPERSVSVLRAWMFQNFLHPYPKDAEKHLLAVKSGLTRSQVSNWFINARVRLWKPMIDEMFAEMNRRKGLSNDKEKDESSRRSHLSIIDCSKTC